jgi:hypothetical protein
MTTFISRLVVLVFAALCPLCGEDSPDWKAALGRVTSGSSEEACKFVDGAITIWRQTRTDDSRTLILHLFGDLNAITSDTGALVVVHLCEKTFSTPIDLSDAHLRDLEFMRTVATFIRNYATMCECARLGLTTVHQHDVVWQKLQGKIVASMIPYLRWVIDMSESNYDPMTHYDATQEPALPSGSLVQQQAHHDSVVRTMKRNFCVGQTQSISDSRRMITIMIVPIFIELATASDHPKDSLTRLLNAMHFNAQDKAAVLKRLE